MARIPISYNWGSALFNDNPQLVRQLAEMYNIISNAVTPCALKYISEDDPPSSVTDNNVNRSLDIGDLWVNTSSDTAWIMTSRVSAVRAVWSKIT